MEREAQEQAAPSVCDLDAWELNLRLVLTSPDHPPTTFRLPVKATSPKSIKRNCPRLLTIILPSQSSSPIPTCLTGPFRPRISSKSTLGLDSSPILPRQLPAPSPCLATLTYSGQLRGSRCFFLATRTPRGVYGPVSPSGKWSFFGKTMTKTPTPTLGGC